MNKEFIKIIISDSKSGSLGDTDYGHALRNLAVAVEDAHGVQKEEHINRLRMIYKQFGDKILEHLSKEARALLENENTGN